MGGNQNFKLFKMMTLKKILFFIQKYIGEVEKRGFTINIKINSKKIDLKGIKVLYFLLNNYEDYYFITIKGLPYCLMPDATEHIIYKKNDKKNYYYDEICKNCDFRKICPGWQLSIINIERKTIKPSKDIPKEIVIKVTTKCNLNCTTCKPDKSKFLNINFETAKKIMNEAKSLDIKAVRFTGGEPLLNKDIEKMLIFAKSNNFYVLLNTNATVINNVTLKLLENTVDNILISLQGFNQKSDSLLTDSHVGFNKKIANIIRLKSKIPIVRVGTAISKTLIHNLDRYYNLLRRINIDNWELYRPIAKDKDKEFKITKEDLIKVMRFLLKVKKEGMKVKIANPLPFCISKNMNLSLATLLGAIADDGHSRIVWDTGGYFKPSYFINENLGKTIKEAWNNSFLRRIKTLNYLPLKCKKCKYLQWCKGGSRALAKITNGDYFSLDPLME